jgi:hypothetical protein
LLIALPRSAPLPPEKHKSIAAGSKETKLRYSIKQKTFTNVSEILQKPVFPKTGFCCLYQNKQNNKFLSLRLWRSIQKLIFLNPGHIDISNKSKDMH